jgi:hypothetical protein
MPSFATDSAISPTRPRSRNEPGYGDRPPFDKTPGNIRVEITIILRLVGITYGTLDEEASTCSRSGRLCRGAASLCQIGGSRPAHHCAESTVFATPACSFPHQYVAL